MTRVYVYCPECDGRIVLNPHPRLGHRFSCRHCDADLEVISIDPPEVDWADDWEYDDEEEDW